MKRFQQSRDVPAAELLTQGLFGLAHQVPVADRVLLVVGMVPVGGQVQ